ncbi:MAG: OmpA family protein [Bacteroidota bacterium]
MKVHFLFSLLLSLLFCACVSNKKHRAALQLQQYQSDSIFQHEVGLRDLQLEEANKNINGLQLQLAERKGENNILMALRKELETQIQQLEQEIEKMNNQSSSTQKNLNTNLRQKEEEIVQLKDLIQEVDAVLNRHTTLLEEVGNQLHFELQSFEEIDQESYELLTEQNQVSLSLQNSLLFRARSVVRLQDDALPLLEKVTDVLLKYPNLNVSIIGHTDNAPPRRRADVDNWNVSAQRAATIVRVMTEDYGLSPSQVLLGARGEYSPQASNATSEGKTKNQRIELRIAPRSEALVKAVKKVID